MAHPRWLRRLFTPADLDALGDAIRGAEARTSAELRLHLERRLPRGARGDALARAREVFVRLGMQRTAGRNGVLLYLALDDRRLAIVGDEAIHARVGDAYWSRVRDAMVERLRAGRPRDALLEAIADAAGVLAQHFPRRPDDTNELSDTISVD
jgi:uncharacterized membrane protein